MINVRMLINRLPQAFACAHVEQRNDEKNNGKKQHQKVPHSTPFINADVEKACGSRLFLSKRGTR